MTTFIEHALNMRGRQHIIPDVAPIRGGTDGARLSFKGLPCPIMHSTGYMSTLQEGDKAVVMVKDIVSTVAELNRDDDLKHYGEVVKNRLQESERVEWKQI